MIWWQKNSKRGPLYKLTTGDTLKWFSKYSCCMQEKWEKIWNDLLLVSWHSWSPFLVRFLPNQISVFVLNKKFHPRASKFARFFPHVRTRWVLRVIYFLADWFDFETKKKNKKCKYKSNSKCECYMMCSM